MAWQSLIIGLVIGWLAELTIDYFFWRKRRICSDAEEELQETVEILKEEVNRLKKKCGEAGDQGAREAQDEEDGEEKEEEEKEPDDLKRVWGIGPKIEVLLNLKGITTFEQLASADHMTLERILEDAGKHYRLSKYNVVESWNDQARMAANGRWQELDAYQANLSGMRRRRHR